MNFIFILLLLKWRVYPPFEARVLTITSGLFECTIIILVCTQLFYIQLSKKSTWIRKALFNYLAKHCKTITVLVPRHSNHWCATKDYTPVLYFYRPNMDRMLLQVICAIHCRAIVGTVVSLLFDLHCGLDYLNSYSSVTIGDMFVSSFVETNSHLLLLI